MALSQEKIQAIQAQLAGLPPEEQQKKLNELLSQLPPEELAEIQKQQCPFCAIVEGSIKAKTVYEDDTVKAVLDINPANKGHIIVFPKTHYQFLFQVPEEDVSHVFKVANLLSKTIFEVLGAQGTNIFVANGQVAGQNAPHVIVHVIPRFEKDGVSFAWKPKQVEEKDMDEVVKKITEKKLTLKKEKVVEEVQVEKEEIGETERIP